MLTDRNGISETSAEVPPRKTARSNPGSTIFPGLFRPSGMVAAWGWVTRITPEQDLSLEISAGSLEAQKRFGDRQKSPASGWQ